MLELRNLKMNATQNWIFLAAIDRRDSSRIRLALFPRDPACKRVCITRFELQVPGSLRLIFDSSSTATLPTELQPMRTMCHVASCMQEDNQDIEEIFHSRLRPVTR